MTTARMLQSVGKRTFVNCFEVRKTNGRDLSKKDVMKADSPCSETWESENALGTKTSRLNRIFREKKECEALKICCEARMLSRPIKAKAAELYERYCNR